MAGRITSLNQSIDIIRNTAMVYKNLQWNQTFGAQRLVDYQYDSHILSTIQTLSRKQLEQQLFVK